MNKLIFFCLLSLMIVYIQSADDAFSKVASPTNQAACDKAENVGTCLFCVRSLSCPQSVREKNAGRYLN